MIRDMSRLAVGSKNFEPDESIRHIARHAESYTLIRRPSSMRAVVMGDRIVQVLSGRRRVLSDRKKRFSSGFRRRRNGVLRTSTRSCAPLVQRMYDAGGHLGMHAGYWTRYLDGMAQAFRDRDPERPPSGLSGAVPALASYIAGQVFRWYIPRLKAGLTMLG